MKGKTRRVISTLFALVMLLSSLAGCGTTAPAPTATPAATTTAAETTAAATTAATPEPTAAAQNYWEMLTTVKDTSDLPTWTGKQLKLKFWLTHGLGEANHPKATNDVVAAEIKRVTGIELDIDNSYDNGGSPLATKFSLMAAANDWPDIGICTDTTGFDQLVKNDKVYDLTDLLAKNAPNAARIFFDSKDGKLVARNQIMKDYLSLKTGGDKLYLAPFQANGALEFQNAQAIPGFSMDKWNNLFTPDPISGGQRIYVRDDILKLMYPTAKTQKEIEDMYMANGTFTKEQMFDVPINSTADFYKFLSDAKAIIEKNKIKESNKSVEVTYAATGTDNWQLMATLMPWINGKVASGYNYTTVYNLKNKAMEWSYDKPYFKDDLKLAWQSVKANVMSQESLLDNNQIFTEKVNNGQYFMTYAWTKPDAAALLKAGKTYQYRQLWVNIPQDTDTWKAFQDPAQCQGVAIFKTVKEADLPQIMHWYDYLMSDPADKMNSWGPRSADLFIEDANGVRTYTNKDLEGNMVYNKDNGENIKYGLYNIALTVRCPWPTIKPVPYDKDWNSPKWSYTKVQNPSDANQFFNLGYLPGMSYLENSMPVNLTAFEWMYPNISDAFNKGRDVFEKSLTKILTAKDEAQFDKLFNDMVAVGKSIGLTDEAIAIADKAFQTANKDIIDLINTPGKYK